MYVADESAPANERPTGQDRQGFVDRLRQRFSPQVQRIDIAAEMHAVMARALEPSAEQARQTAAERDAAWEKHLAYVFADDIHPGRDRTTLSNEEFLEVLQTADERRKGTIDAALTERAASSATTGSPGPQGVGADALRHATSGVSDANRATNRDAGTTSTPATHSTSKPAAKVHEI